MIEQGVLLDGEPYELLEGRLVHKLSRGSPHGSAIQALTKRLIRMVSGVWDVRVQSAVTMTGGSEPEPAFAFVRGDESIYRNNHPGPTEIGLLIEVSDNSLYIDRHDKGSIYANNKIAVYWVVNVVDNVIEVYTQPSGSGITAAYAQRDDYTAGMTVPVVLDGSTIGTIAVSEVMG